MSSSSSDGAISRAARVGEALGDLEQLLLDQREHAGLVAEQLAQLADALGDVGVLLLDRVALQRGELRQAQVEDRGGLDLLSAKRVQQAARARPRGPARRGSASMMASRLSSAISRPSRTCARASFCASSNFVRRTMTSRWCPT